jgi:hypothetical protein
MLRSKDIDVKFGIHPVAGGCHAPRLPRRLTSLLPRRPPAAGGAAADPRSAPESAWDPRPRAPPLLPLLTPPPCPAPPPF